MALAQFENYESHGEQGLKPDVACWVEAIRLLPGATQRDKAEIGIDEAPQESL